MQRTAAQILLSLNNEIAQYIEVLDLKLKDQYIVSFDSHILKNLLWQLLHWRK